MGSVVRYKEIPFPIGGKLSNPRKMDLTRENLPSAKVKQNFPIKISKLNVVLCSEIGQKKKIVEISLFLRYEYRIFY